MAVTVPVDRTEPFIVGVEYVDSKGNKAQVDGVPTWSSSDESIFSVQPLADDPFKAEITFKSVGMAQLKAVADADLGEGMDEVITLGDIDVVAGKAVAGKFTFPESV